MDTAVGTRGEGPAAPMMPTLDRAQQRPVRGDGPNARRSARRHGSDPRPRSGGAWRLSFCHSHSGVPSPLGALSRWGMTLDIAKNAALALKPLRQRQASKALAHGYDSQKDEASYVRSVLREALKAGHDPARSVGRCG